MKRIVKQQKRFIETYLNESQELRGEEEREQVSTDEIALTVSDVMRFRILLELFWGIWGILQVFKLIDNHAYLSKLHSIVLVVV